MIVMAILAILAGMAITQYNSYKNWIKLGVRFSAPIMWRLKKSIVQTWLGCLDR